MNAGSGKGRSLRTEGQMPLEEPLEEQGPRREEEAGRSLQEEGERKAKRARGILIATVQDDLERAMEREMYLQLHEENLRLKMEMEAMQQQKADPQSIGMVRGVGRTWESPNRSTTCLENSFFFRLAFPSLMGLL